MDVTSSLPSYRFPLLKNQEIIECLTDAGIEITSNELTEPNRHKDRVKSIFNDLVIIGLNIPKDTFTTTSMSLMQIRQSLPHPELHEDSFTNLKFIKALMKLMRISGIHDFGIHDLHSPTTKRFRRQLSAIINYIKFMYEKNASLIHEINEHKDGLINDLLKVRKEQEMLNLQLEEVQRDADQKWKDAKVVDDDCGEVEIEIAKQNKLQAEIRKESEALKKESNRLKDLIDTTDLELQELGVKERKLLPQVVESPDQLQKDIEALSQTLDEEKELCLQAEEGAKLMLTREKNVIKAQHDVVDATNFAKQVLDDKAKYEKVLEETHSIQENIQNNQSEAAKYRQKYEKLERELHQIEEKTNNFQQQAKTKMDAANASLHAVNAELLIVEKDRRDTTSKVEQYEQEVELLKRLINEEKIKTDEEIEEIISSFKKMERVIVDKLDKFDASIEMTAAQ